MLGCGPPHLRRSPAAGIITSENRNRLRCFSRLPAGTAAGVLLVVTAAHALIDMLGDPVWRLPGPERRRVLGLVDDAITLDLVLDELQRQLEQRGGNFPLITHF